MLILALLSQLLGAAAATLIVVRALQSPIERLLTHLPPAGATSARRWLLLSLAAVGITSGLHFGMSPGAFGGPMWPFFGPGSPHLDPSLLQIAGLEAASGAVGALRGLAFAALFLFGVSVIGNILATGRERTPAIGRGTGEPRLRGGRDRDRGREMPLGPRPGRIDEPRDRDRGDRGDRGGEPRRLPGGGGRGRGPAPGRERREGHREGRDREGRSEIREGREREGRGESREGFREPVGSALRSGGPGFAGPRHGARPIPDPPAVMPAAGAPVAVERSFQGREPRDGR